jgi:hypothetical protein
MQINYKQDVTWDISLIDVGFLGSEINVPSTIRGLACEAVDTVTGSPSVVNGQWIPGALIINAIDATLYQMTGTTAACAWTLVDAGTVGVTSLTGDVTGTGPGVTAATLADSVKVYTTKVSLTSSQILALNTTAISLLVAPGTGKIYEVLSVKGRINFVTAAYATHTELDIIDATTGNVLFKDASALLASTSTVIATIPPIINSNVGVIITTNGAISAKAAAGNPITGGGSVDLYITYKIVTL